MKPSARTWPGEEGASEVIGYVLMLFLSAAVLVLSLQAFQLSRASGQDVLDGAELKLVTDRVAAEVLAAASVATDMPNATFETTLRLPSLPTRGYFLNLTSQTVYANTTDGKIHAEAGAFQVGALSSMTIQGRLTGDQGYVRIRYLKDDTGNRFITLQT